MKLYYAPGACSLADHIALHEAGLEFDREKVDLKAKMTESGIDFMTINPKGYVPALTLDDGTTITENIAILDWISQQDAKLAPPGARARTRLLEALAYISTELHKSFKPFFAPDADEDARAKAQDLIGRRLDHIARLFEGDYLFGAAPTVADAYLFVMLLWCEKFDIAVPDTLAEFVARMRARTAVRDAMVAEGLTRS